VKLDRSQCREDGGLERLSGPDLESEREMKDGQTDPVSGAGAWGTVTPRMLLAGQCAATCAATSPPPASVDTTGV
jgi:hypothetical protein